MLPELFGVITAALVGVWVYRDALKRGKSPFTALLWGMAVFMALIIFLPLWLITRPKTQLKPEINTTEEEFSWRPCPLCRKYIKGKPPFCPKCGGNLGGDLKVY
jgi:hypothetical protein